MSKDTVVLQMHGDVPLELYGKISVAFYVLLSQITIEVSGTDLLVANANQVIQWRTRGTSNLMIRAQGLPVENDLEVVDRAVRAYDSVGEALATREIIPFSQNVANAAYKLTSPLNGKVTGLTMSTDSVFESAHLIEGQVKPPPVQSGIHYVSWGSIRGEVGAIAKRPKLQFTLYDTLFDKAVACVLPKERVDLARSIWGKRVEITGRVMRRVDNDRPVSVRDITDVRVLESQSSLKDFYRLLPFSPGDELPEVVLRRDRNDW